MAKPKKKYDWEEIEKDMRAGLISIREISRRTGCPESSIRKKKKEQGWERDLTDAVRKRAQSKLLRNNVRNSNVNDEEIIQEKSKELVDIQLSHRKDIANLRELESELIAEIKDAPKKLWIGQYQGNIVSKELELTVAERSAAANNLANVQHKRIALERQAHNLDDGDKSKDSADIYVTMGTDDD